jgi:sortase A
LIMPLMDKQRREIDTRRPNYAVFRKRRRIGLLVLVILATLFALIIGSYLFSDTMEDVSEAPPEEVETPVPVEEEASQEESAAEKKAAEERAAAEEEERKAAAVPDDPTLFLTVPKLGIYGHTVRNDDSEAALDLGAIKVPSSGFPWEKKDTNTYIACHRIGWPGTESYNQCLNLPAMQKGDEIYLQDTLGRVYQYRVSELRAVSPNDSWVANPVSGNDVVSLQTCTESPDDWWTIGPSLFGGGPESGRLVVQAERV